MAGGPSSIHSNVSPSGALPNYTEPEIFFTAGDRGDGIGVAATDVFEQTIQYFWPGTGPDPIPNIPTFFLPAQKLTPNELNPSSMHGEDEEDLFHLAETFVGQDRAEMMKYPLIKLASEATSEFIKTQEEKQKDPGKFRIIDVARDVVWDSDACDVDSSSVCVPADDNRFLYFRDIVAGLSERLRAKQLSISEAVNEARKLSSEMSDYKTEEISDRAYQYLAEINLLKRELAQIETRKTVTRQCASTLLFIGIRQSPIQSKPDASIEVSILNLRRKLDIAERSLKGLSQYLVLVNSMLALASGTTEDEVLGQAGQIMGSFDFKSEAYNYFSQAKELANKFGDEVSERRQDLNLIKYNPALNDNARLEAYLSFIGQEYLFEPFSDYEHALDSATFRAYNLPLRLKRYVEEGIAAELSSIRAEAISEMARLSAEKAGDDPEVESFLTTLEILDGEIERATTSQVINSGQVAHLTMAAVAVLEPFKRAAQQEASRAMIEDRDELIAKITARASSVEKMYEAVIKRFPEEKGNGLLSTAMGVLGAQTYFHIPRETGFSYDAAVQTFERYVAKYPDSSAKIEIVKLIQYLAPHLFDGGDRFLPVGEHTKSPDWQDAHEEIEKLNILPGTFGEQISADFAGSAMLGAAGAKGGAVAGAILGPEAALAVGAIGGTIGVFMGSVGGSAAVRWFYSDEIEKLSKQAEMSGMRLAGLEPGEGDKQVAYAYAMFALPALFAPAGRLFAVKIGDKLIEITSEGGRKYLWQELKREGVKLGRCFPAAWHAAKGFLKLTKNGDDLSLLPVAQQLAGLLGIGSHGTAERLAMAKGIILEKAGETLARNLRMVVNVGDEPVADAVAKILMTDGPEIYSRFSKFKSLIGKVSKGSYPRSQFEKELAEILGQEKGEALAKAFAPSIYNGGGGKAETSVRASQVRDALNGSVGEPEEFVDLVLRGLKQVGDEEQTTKMVARSIGPADVPKLLRLVKLFSDDGVRLVQLERLIKEMVRDVKTGGQLLETMLMSRTVGDFMSEVGVQTTASIKELTISMLSKEAQDRLYRLAREALQSEAISNETFVSETFFNALRQLKGGENFINRFVEEGANVLDVTVRRGALRRIVGKEDSCRRLIDLVIGKGLTPKELSDHPVVAKDILLGVLIESGARTKGLQHGMKEVLRPIFRSWRNVSPHMISEVQTRGMVREANYALSQALTVSDDAGRDFMSDVVRELAPWHLEKYSGDMDAAIKALKAEVTGNLIAQLKRNMNFRPDNGIFDFIVRPANDVADRYVLNPFDRWLSRRVEMAAKFVAAANPDQTWRHHPLLWRKMLLRSAYTERARRLGHLNVKPKVISDDFPHPVLDRLERGVEFLGKRIFTEEVRKAHRVCMPIYLADTAASLYTGGELSSLGMVCMMIGGNYYLERVGGNTYAMDIAMAQRAFLSSASKWDADSDDLFDIQRTKGTYADGIFGLYLQNLAFYGLNFTSRLPGGMIFDVPFARRILPASNGIPYFSFFNGTLNKPDYLVPGVWGKIRGLSFQTGMSTIQSMVISSVTKGSSFINAHPDLVGSRGFNYALNGPAVNVPGYLSNIYLERKNPNAGLMSAVRQAVERTLGVFTGYLALQPFDIYAGKGDFVDKQNRILGEAADGDGASSLKAWDLFARRYNFDLLGWWNAVEIGRDGVNVLPGRALRPHFGPAWNIEQLRSWYSENDMQFSDKRLHKGYFIELAREHPERLAAFLKGFEHQLTSPKASWRDSNWPPKREAHKKALYYFSVISKYFAEKAKNGQREYEPFKTMSETSSFQDYWQILPVAKDEQELERIIIQMEDLDRGVNAVSGDLLDLEDFLAHVRTQRRTLGFPFTNPDAL